MGKYVKQKKNNEQKFYEGVIQQIGMLIFHSVFSTIFILLSIVMGVGCATNGGYWVYLLFLIVCIAVVIYSISQVIVNTCNILLLIKELHDGKRKY